MTHEKHIFQEYHIKQFSDSLKTHLYAAMYYVSPFHLVNRYSIKVSKGENTKQQPTHTFTEQQITLATYNSITARHFWIIMNKDSETLHPIQECIPADIGHWTPDVLDANEAFYPRALSNREWSSLLLTHPPMNIHYSRIHF